MLGPVRRSNCSRILSLVFCLVGSCGEEEPEPFEALDPTEPQYGKTFAEWAAEWVYYVQRYAPPLCDDPIKNPTGDTCAVGQDPASPVFFLVGTYGGPAVRKECVVPADVALFFPLANVWGDPAGVTGEVWTDEAVKANIEETVPTFVEDSLYATVDGRPVEDLAKGIMKEAVPYRVHVPEGPNNYTCDGIDGVSGEFGGYVLGSWVMLPPLGPGKHTITFGSYRKADALSPAFQLDVRYELTVASVPSR